MPATSLSAKESRFYEERKSQISAFSSISWVMSFAYPSFLYHPKPQPRKGVEIGDKRRLDKGRTVFKFKYSEFVSV